MTAGPPDADQARAENDARELGNIGEQVDDDHRDHRNGAPAEPEALADQLGMAEACADREPRGHLLDEIEDRHKREDRQQHDVAEVGAGLGRRKDARRVDVGDHHDPGRADHAREAPEPCPSPSRGQRSGGHSHSVGRHARSEADRPTASPEIKAT